MLFFFTIPFLFLHASAFGQTCIHGDLSRSLRITVTKRKSGDSAIVYQFPIEVTIIDKASKKKIQVISFKAIDLYPASFTKCNWVRSYSTGKNRNAIVRDTDFGDVVVADFNFDSREVIAIKSDDEFAGT
jgi:hypothetical protein